MSLHLHLLDLPPEILEHILVFLCHTKNDAQSIQACRQTCHTLNTIIAQSKLVQYLERLALLGLYDPPLNRALIDGDHGNGSTTTFASASLALPDRAAALQAWEESWNSLTGGDHHHHDHHHRERVRDTDGVPEDLCFWQKRKPDLRISLPPRPSSSWPCSPRVKYILANILEPDPPLDYQMAVDATEGGQGQHGYLDKEDRFSFGPWFIAATRDGLNVRASYSYLDLHGCLGDVGGGRGQCGLHDDGDVCADEYDRAFWTVVKIPLWNVVAFVLSTELDLTVVISCVCIYIYFPFLNSYFFFRGREYTVYPKSKTGMRRRRVRGGGRRRLIWCCDRYASGMGRRTRVPKCQLCDCVWRALRCFIGRRHRCLVIICFSGSGLVRWTTV